MADAKNVTVKVEVKAEELVDACIKALVEDGTLVEVVRCKDCKHRPYKDDDGDVYPHSWDDETCPCTCEDSFYNWMPDDDFFCGKGERRDDGLD